MLKLDVSYRLTDVARTLTLPRYLGLVGRRYLRRTRKFINCHGCKNTSFHGRDETAIFFMPSMGKKKQGCIVEVPSFLRSGDGLIVEVEEDVQPAR